MRVFKHVFKDRRTGASRQTSKYYIEFKDPSGRMRKMPGLSAKSATEEFGRKVDRLVACRVAGTRIDPDLVKWVESLPQKVHQRLLKFGLLDAQQVGTVRPLADHLADFEATLRAKNNTDAYVDQLVGRVRRLLDGCGFRYWSDLSASRIQTYLADLRRDTKEARGISVQTSNFYLRAVQQFAKWMHRDRRAAESPVAHLSGLNVRVDRRHDRRPLTVEEMIWLLDATESGPERAGVGGADRALTYRLAAETGLRAGELASLTVGSFSLDEDPPTVTVQAGYSKHRKQDVIMLKKGTAAFLKGRFAGRMPTVPAVRVLDRNCRTKVLRQDLGAARAAWLAAEPDPQTRVEMDGTDFLMYRRRDGRFAGFHAFRSATGSFLNAGGVNMKVIQSILRHSDIGLTANTYSHAYREDEVQAVEKLPDLGRRPEKKRQADAG